MHTNLMKSFVFATLLTFLAVYNASAQDTSYHLPKTGVRVALLVEKTSYKPGDLAAYTQRFLKKQVAQEESVQYRIVNVTMSPCALPDSSRIFTAHIDNKRNIQEFNLSPDNILLAINAEPRQMAEPAPFVAAAKPAADDPYRHLNQDILSAGSRMKMAELCAQEIYDIRESRSELTKGQADYMPKDGEQLRIMLQNLETQESAIRQLFEGVTQCDTIQTVMTFVPERDMTKVPLFRFSKHYGIVDSSDLSGEPYYMIVENLNSCPPHINEQGKKAPKDETGIWIALPGKIRLTVTDGQMPLNTTELSASQFGEIENLNEPLFSKKVMTRLVLNPYNGGIEDIESAPIKN